jgi:two-component system OmpR family sensor kinase
MWKRIRLNLLTRHVPIRWRLTLISLGVLTLLLVVLSVVISLLAEQALLANEVNVLHNEAHLAVTGIKGRAFDLARISEPPPGPPPPNFLVTAADLAHRLASPSTNAAILAPDGSILIPANSFLFTSGAVTLSPTTVQQTLAHDEDGMAYVLARDAHGDRQIIVLIPLISNYHTVGILQMSTPTAPIDNFLTTLRLLLVLGVAVAVLLAAAVTFPLVSVALRPLVEIERASRRIARGALSERIDPPLTDDEIGHLAVSFNRMVARLEDAFRRQKQFVADVSHELRTPLTALSGSLEMLMIGADQGDVEAARCLARGMYGEVKRMRRLVEDLLVLTRLDGGKLALREDIVQVGPVLEAVYEQSQYLAHGQELVCVVEPELPPVRADKDRLQQVLLNIVENALKFTPATGHVELRASHTSHNTVEIAVCDSGRGIPPEALAHVFERFYRADPSRSRQPHQGGGSGLGLAIAKELTEAQGGTISISSVLDEGTTVTLSFPAARVQGYALAHGKSRPVADVKE